MVIEVTVSSPNQFYELIDDLFLNAGTPEPDSNLSLR